MSILARLTELCLSPSLPCCGGCGHPIHGAHVKALDRSWHPDHFTCSVCHDTLGARFHVGPHQEPYCLGHPPETVVCPSCGHVRPPAELASGSCLSCAQEGPIGETEATALAGSIQAWLREAGLPWWPQPFPVSLVGAETLRTRLPHLAEGGRLMGMIQTSTHIESGMRIVRRVDGILALQGCTRLLLGTVLAHELGHAWIFQKGLGSLPQVEEEGFCEFCSHQWLASVRDPRAPYLRDRIARNSHPVYGEGFRAMQARAGGGGLRHLAQQLVEGRS